MGTWKGDSNPGGPGGRTRKIQPNKGGKPPKKGCCPMVEAGRSIKRGNYRLARRYAVMSVRLIMAMGTYDEKSSKWINPPKKRRSPADSGNNKSCCFGAAAIKSAKQGKFRLARRYAILSARAIAHGAF